jgi:serine phosphatase RsbU (regulator of sigma subunit)
MEPAATVGGDYFDVINVGGKDWTLVGDVSGHGVPAGLIMMMVQTAVRTALWAHRGELTAAELLRIVNKAVTPNLEKIGKGQYMTITALAFDGQRVQFAGLHEDILIHRAKTDAIERVETDGAWIGVMEDIGDGLRDYHFDLEPGDTVLLVSDGVTEARQHGEFLGDQGLEKLFEQFVSHPSCDEVVQSLRERLQSFETHDDVTMLAIRRKKEATGAAA